MPPRSLKRKGKEAVAIPATQSFQFIHLGSEAQILQDDDRSIIREVVMNNYHRKKRQRNFHKVEDVPPRGNITRGIPISGQINIFQLRPDGLEPQSIFIEDSHSSNDTEIEEINAPNKPQSQYHASGFSDALNRWGISSLRKSPTPGTVESVQAFNAREKEDAAAMRRLTESLNIVPKTLDPLISFPSTEPQSKHLVHHFFTDRSHSSMLMMGVRKSWFQASLQDPAFFNVILAHYAACVTLRTKSGDPVESLVLRMEASRIVKARLDEGEHSISDSTIGAVASMVVYEANNGDTDAIRTHIKGLAHMVKLRGGFQNANFTPSIQRQIAWAELQTSNVLSTSPTILPFSSPSLDLEPYSFTAGANGPLVATHSCISDYVVDFSQINTDIPTIFNDLRYLTTVLEEQLPSSIKERDSMWYSDKVYMVQRNLVYLEQNPDPAHSMLDGACCVAASIFSHVYLRDLGLYSKVVEIIVGELEKTLERTVNEILEYGTEDELRKLLWILTIGGIAAYRKPHRGRFVEWLEIVCRRIEICEMRQIVETVENILWSKAWIPWLEIMWIEIRTAS